MHGAIMAALYARVKTGEGQKIDGSLFETQVALLTNVALSWLNLGVEAERWGAQHPSGSYLPLRPVPSADFRQSFRTMRSEPKTCTSSVARPTTSNLRPL